MPRLRAIVRDAQATAVLTTSAVLSKIDVFSAQAPDLKALRWLATDAHGVVKVVGNGRGHRIPGDHYTLLVRPNVETLAERLRYSLRTG